MATCGTLTVQAEADPSRISITGCSGPTLNSVNPENRVQVSISVDNPNQSGEFDVTLQLQTQGGTQLGQTSATIRPSTSSLEVAGQVPAQPGTYTLQVRVTGAISTTVTCDSVQVNEVFNPNNVGLPSGACTNPTPQNASPGQQVEVDVQVNNDNPTAADAEIIVETSAGRELARSNEQVAPGGSSVRVTFTAPQQAGDYTIEVRLGSVTQASGDAPARKQSSTGSGLPSLLRN